jgi:CheY-like chemotaxis protein
MGIDDKVNRGIFEPLFTLREVGGKENGLGTNSVHGIIQRHQGLISVESENGRGATCILCLPALSDESAAFPAEPALQGILIDGQETLLLVDDDVPVLRTTKEHLKELGYTLHTAKNGPEALGIYQDRWKEIDLVILDPVMPGMDGATVFDALKEINPKVKCLLSTGHSLDGLAGDAMKRGFAGYIQKPFDLFEISQRIRDVLETDDFPASSPATG